MTTTPAMPELPREAVIAIGKKHFPKTTLSNAWFGFAADIALATLQAQPAEVKRPQAAPVGFDVEAMIRAVLPGGNYCDPQAVADAIRDYVAASPQAVPMTASRSERISSLQAELNLLREQEAKEIISGAPNDLRSECLALVDSRRMVGAIKHYREKVGCGLLEAKYAVEAMVTGRLAHGITAPAGQPKE